MMKIVFLCALVVIIAASPRSLKVQETAHQVARSIKNSNDYSLEEKEELLANLKAINKDAKEFSSAHGHKKSQLKKDLRAKLAAVKSEMQAKELEQQRAREAEEQRRLEEEEALAKQRVAAVHEDIKAVKGELKAAHLKGADKKQAKKLYKSLEHSYSSLAAQTTKAGREEVARAMKVTTAELKKILTKETLEAKKEKIMSLVRSAEEELASKKLKSDVKQEMHQAFEEMKNELNEESNVHELQSMLKSKLASIKQMEAQALADQEDDFEEDSENDFEEENSDDQSSKAAELEESASDEE